MQLLDSEQLEYAFQLYGINRDAQARQFYTRLWKLIQTAEKIRDLAELSKCEQKLRHLCLSYFSDMAEWRALESEQFETLPCCPSSRNNARESSLILPAFEKQFFRYALCYMELNRALIQIRAKLSNIAKDYNIDTMDILQVNHATGALLERAHKERLKIMEDRLRLNRVKSVLHQLDPLMEGTGEALPRYFGSNKGDHQLTLFKGALRKQKFAEARKIIKAWQYDKLSLLAYRAVDLCQKNAGELKAQDGLMLHSGELSLIHAFLKNDEDRANQFLEKFNLPYMVFQYKNLIHLGYLLGRVGTLEGLIVHHAKLVSLAARLHNDPDQAQIQEQSVLVPARAQMQGRFRTLGAIFNDMETTIAILEKLFSKTHEYMPVAPAQ